MTNGLKQSDPAIVPVKSANKGTPVPAEPMEGRAGTKGNPRGQSTHRTQGRDRVSQAAERIRQAATRNPKEKLTALLHHIMTDVLEASYFKLKQDAAAAGALNAVLLKPNQAGSLTECRAALDAARAAGYGSLVSARSGETEDVTVVHLAVGWGVRQLKVGSIAHGERTAKWNEGLRIAETLPDGGRLPPRVSFPWSTRCV